MAGAKNADQGHQGTDGVASMRAKAMTAKKGNRLTLAYSEWSAQMRGSMERTDGCQDKGCQTMSTKIEAGTRMCGWYELYRKYSNLLVRKDSADCADWPMVSFASGESV